MSIITGHDLRIYANGNPIAGAKSCSLKINNDLNEVSTKSTGRAKSFIYGRYDYTVDSDGMYLANATTTENGITVTSNKALIASAIQGTTVTFEFKSPIVGETGYTKYSGVLLVKSADISAPDYKEMSFKASFQGTGELSSTDITA